MPGSGSDTSRRRVDAIEHSLREKTAIHMVFYLAQVT